MKILLTGKNGQLGWELARTLAPLGEVIAVDRNGLDLADTAAITSVVRKVQPQLIVNAAAYTAVDRAQSESAQAHAINATAPEILAREARALHAVMIHFSTDYVFAGDQPGAYNETDKAAPMSVYGQSKLAGEQAVAASGAAHLILRTSWVYAARGANFLLTMLRLARANPELAVVADQFGAPTWSRMIAEATAQIVARNRTPEAMHEAMQKQGGIYHLTAAGRTTWHGFAEAIMRESHLATPVRAIGTADYPLPAPRPANSILSNAKLAGRFGIALPAWETSLAQCLEELAPRNATPDKPRIVPR